MKSTRNVNRWECFKFNHDVEVEYFQLRHNKIGDHRRKETTYQKIVFLAILILILQISANYCFTFSSRSDRFASDNTTGTHRFVNDELKDESMDLEDHSIYGSEYSFCSCSYCREPKKNPLFGRSEIRLSYSER